MLAVSNLGTATVFMTKADLRAAVRAYKANATDAIATYGPIAGWDVSAITDMNELFYELAPSPTRPVERCCQTKQVPKKGVEGRRREARRRPKKLRTIHQSRPKSSRPPLSTTP